MRNTKENKRNIKSKNESIDVPEFEDLHWSKVVVLTSKPQFIELGFC